MRHGTFLRMGHTALSIWSQVVPAVLQGLGVSQGPVLQALVLVSGALVRWAVRSVWWRVLGHLWPRRSLLLQSEAFIRLMFCLTKAQKDGGIWLQPEAPETKAYKTFLLLVSHLSTSSQLRHGCMWGTVIPRRLRGDGTFTSAMFFCDFFFQWPERQKEWNTFLSEFTGGAPGPSMASSRRVLRQLLLANSPSHKCLQ